MNGESLEDFHNNTFEDRAGTNLACFCKWVDQLMCPKYAYDGGVTTCFK